MTHPSRIAWWTLVLGLFFLIPIEEPFAAGRPETYVGLYGGVTLPQSFKDVEGIGGSSGFKLTDLDLKQSAVVGAKLGMFLPGRDRWSGIETEFFYTSPHIKQQDVGFTFSGAPLGSFTFAGAHVRISTWAVNWILRYPGKRFQPYVGVGPGIFWGRVSGSDFGSASDTSLGLNALGGVRLLLTERLAVFGEYKYNRTSFDFGGNVELHALYQAHMFVGGLSLHF